MLIAIALSLFTSWDPSQFVEGPWRFEVVTITSRLFRMSSACLFSSSSSHDYYNHTSHLKRSRSDFESRTTQTTSARAWNRAGCWGSWGIENDRGQCTPLFPSFFADMDYEIFECLGATTDPFKVVHFGQSRIHWLGWSVLVAGGPSYVSSSASPYC